MDLEIENIIGSIKYACVQISEKVVSNNPFVMSNIVSTNESNDDVKNLDIFSNDILIESLSKNINVKIQCVNQIIGHIIFYNYFYYLIKVLFKIFV